jgi:hypothetical protein
LIVPLVIKSSTWRTHAPRRGDRRSPLQLPRLRTNASLCRYLATVPAVPHGHQRYALIVPLVIESLPRGELTLRAEEIAARRCDFPESERTGASADTLLKWACRASSLRSCPALLNGSSARIRIAPARLYCVRWPCLPARQHGLSEKRLLAPHAYKKFEAELSNQIWRTDILFGPSVQRPKGGRMQVYLHATCLRQAVAARGVPTRMYIDNAKLYRPPQLARIAASLGAMVIHSCLSARGPRQVGAFLPHRARATPRQP